jgi:acyl-CoA thioesterase-1
MKTNTPQSMDHKIAPDQFIFVSAGDSITRAIFSSDYLSILKEKLSDNRYKFVNAGQNGDRSEDLLKRIEKDVLACDPHFITILIGANDARQDVDLNQALGAYRRMIEDIILKVRKHTTIPVALISLAPLGENPQSSKNKAVGAYNAILKDIAAKQDLGYLPFFEKLTTIISNKSPLDTSEFKLSLATALLKAAFQKFILRKGWNAIAESNGFSILTDGIHLNDKAGNILADLILEWLLNVSKEKQAAPGK